MSRSSRDSSLRFARNLTTLGPRSGLVVVVIKNPSAVASSRREFLQPFSLELLRALTPTSSRYLPPKVRLGSALVAPTFASPLLVSLRQLSSSLDSFRTRSPPLAQPHRRAGVPFACARSVRRCVTRTTRFTPKVSFAFRVLDRKARELTPLRPWIPFPISIRTVYSTSLRCRDARLVSLRLYLRRLAPTRTDLPSLFNESTPIRSTPHMLPFPLLLVDIAPIARPVDSILPCGGFRLLQHLFLLARARSTQPNNL